MLTTCPECRTTFRIGQAELDDKRGLVRCGHCQAVFNAYDTLLPELAAPPQEPAAAGAGVEQPAMTVVEDDGLDLPLAVDLPQAPRPNLEIPAALPDDVGTPDASAESAQPEDDVGARHSASVDAEAINARQSGAPGLETEADSQPGADSVDILLTPLATRQARSEGRWLAAIAWGLASLLLLSVLLAQLAFFLRGELVVAVPSLHAPMQHLCARIGCAMPLARDLTALRIEASALETDPEDNTRATLHLSLSNRAAQAVAWPYLILVLTDTQDLPIAQRPFTPAEYLPRGIAPDGGLGPGQEREIHLELELKGLSAYGYKLDMDYP